MGFEFSIDTGNAAFEGDDLYREVARILREVATKIENQKADGLIFDINGNRVGTFSLDVPDEPEEADDSIDTHGLFA